MADLPVQPVQNFGSLLSSYGEGLADQQNASTNRLNAQASLAQVPSEIAARQAGIGQTQANTGLVGSQTQGKDIENQRSALMLQLTKNALHNYAESSDAAAAPKPGADNEGGSDSAPAAAPDSDGTPPPTRQTKNPDSRFKDDDDSAAHFDQVASDKFRVNPAFTPQEQAQFSAAIPLAIGGDHGMLDAVKAQHDQRVQTQTANSQNQAQQAFDKMYAVNTAPAGTNFTALKGAYPAAADHLAKIHDVDPDHLDKITPAQQKELDDSAKKYSSMLHDSLFQYTGDKLEDKNGVTVNSRTGLRTVGGQTQGLTPAQWADKYKEATTLDSVPDPNGGPEIKIAHWRAQGFPNAAAYVRGTSGNAANAPGAPAATPGATTVGGGDQPVSGAGAGTTPNVPASQAGSAPPTASSLTQDPVLRKALADPEFNLPKPAATPAGGFAGMGKQQEETLKARTDILKDSQDATQAAALSNQYMLAAKQILDSKTVPTTGPFGKLLAQASAALPGQHVDATNYQEVAKYLGNAALAQAKGIYGSRMTQSEVGLQLNELSPSVHMTDEAVRNLLDTNIASSKYTIDSAHRVRQYLTGGKDPQQFSTWNEKYFPRGTTVNGPGASPDKPQTVTNPASKAAPKSLPNDAKLGAYAAAHFGGDAAKAKAFLISQGYK